MDLERAHGSVTGRRWTARTYLDAFRTGVALVLAELAALVGLSKTEEPTQADLPTKRPPQLQDLTGIHYMFWAYSRVCALTLTWTPSFLFDVRAGTKASTMFALNAYFVATAGSIGGAIIAVLIFANTIKQTLPGLVARVSQLINFFFLISEVGYVAFGLVCMAWMTYRRRFIHDFVLYTCSSIRLPAQFQRRTLIRSFLLVSLFTLMSEPIYSFTTVWRELKQPEVFPHMDAQTFRLVRLVILSALVLVLLPLSVLQTLVPVMTCSLSCLAAKHIEMSLEKQLDRLYGKKQHSFVSLRVLDTEQEAKMTPDDHTLVRQFAIDTLYSDWPSIGERPANPSKDTDDNLAVRSHLFLYKSIAKTLSELKTITRRYDRVFGNIHAMLITHNGVLVADWVVVGVIQSRMVDGKGPSQGDRSSLTNMFLLRTYMSVFMFMASNAILFARCNRLPSEMQKLRIRLFKSNLQLVYSASRPDNRGGQTALSNSPMGDQDELELCWSMYDQVDRLSREANFKLTSNTYYSKRCLLLIFSREISLVLLYMQVIDVYSNV